MQTLREKLTHFTPSVKTDAQAVVYPHLRGSIVAAKKSNGDRTRPLDCPEDRQLLQEYCETGDFERAVKHAQLSRSPITLTEDADLQTTRERARVGSKGMNSRARHSLMAAASTLERKCPPKTLGFFTATIPNLDGHDCRVVHSAWERVIKNFLQSLRDYSVREGFKLTHAYVSEIQEQRYKSTGFPWLHLHVVFRCRKHGNAPFYIEHSLLREKWVQALNSVCDGNPYHTAVTHIAVVEKSVTNYLGKYMSKGVSAVSKVVEDGFTDYLPRQWWGCSRRLSIASKALTLRKQSWLAACIRDAIRHNSKECFSWIAPIEIEDAQDGKVQVGWVFQVTESFYQELLQMVDIR